jgi:hypothetical protein
MKQAVSRAVSYLAFSSTMKMDAKYSIEALPFTDLQGIASQKIGVFSIYIV